MLWKILVTTFSIILAFTPTLFFLLGWMLLSPESFWERLAIMAIGGCILAPFQIFLIFLLFATIEIRRN